MNYSLWNPGEPNGGGDVHCAYVNLYFNGASNLVDVGCEINLDFICEVQYNNIYMWYTKALDSMPPCTGQKLRMAYGTFFSLVKGRE
jgi:hypothetical protein